MATSHSAPTDIAIIGMAGLFPGAKDIHAYWHNIVHKVDNIKDAPDDWAEPYYDPSQDPKEKPMFIYTRKVGLLGSLAAFNPMEYGVLPSSVDGGEPDHFIALKLAGDALKDAGYWKREFNREKTGIILGRGSYPNRGLVSGIQCGVSFKQTIDMIRQFFPHLDDATVELIQEELIRCLPTHEIEKAQSLISNVATGRIANRLNLMGPNYMIDAACSSCHIAVDLAVRDLQDGRCDMVLAGAVQASMPPLVYQLFCQLDALSRRHIRPFGKEADGTILGEGGGFLVLKRLEDAEQDGDRIYAVIKGVGLSSDGRGLGMLAPRFEGQVLAIRRAYEQTGIDPATVDLLEAHGTGIPLGDRTELKSLTEVFGQRQGRLPRCAIGSVKSMIGHCIPASGAASLIKIALALYYKTLPPTLCDEVNPDLGIDDTPFYVNTETRPWLHPTNSPRRAAIDAFGFGGINGHAILEEYCSGRETHLWTLGRFDQPDAIERDVDQVWRDWPTELLVFTASDRTGIQNRIQEVLELLQAVPDINLADLAYTLCQQVSDNEGCRLTLVVKDIEELQQKLTVALEKLADTSRSQWQTRSGIYYGENLTPPGKVAFMFSGEGAQYPNMLLDLCLHFPQAATWFNFLDETFDDREAPISRFIYPPPTGLTPTDQAWITERIFAGDLATEALFGSSMGLYDLLCDFGIRCDMMAGHSSGEHIAMAAGGNTDYPSREVCMEHMRRLNQLHHFLEESGNLPKGTVISVGGLDIAELQTLLTSLNGVAYLVADNCPKQQTIFAQAGMEDRVIQVLQSAGGLCVRLPFDRGVHTPLYEAALPHIKAAYIETPIKASIVPVYSCANAAPFPRTASSAEEAAQLMRESQEVSVRQWASPVRFRETVEQLYEDGARVFIEVGASSSLVAFINSTLQRKTDYLALATCNQRKPALEQIQTLLARLVIQGISVRLSSLYKHREVNTISLAVDSHLRKSSPMSYPINLLLPRLVLSPEFLDSIKDKLYPAQSGSFPEVTTAPFAREHLTSSGEGTSLSSVPEPITPALLLPTREPHGDSVASPLPFASAPVQEEPRLVADVSSDSVDGEINGTRLSSSPGSINVEPERTVQISMDAETQAAILAGHFELMQAFLSHQAQVASAFFTSQSTTPPSH